MKINIKSKILLVFTLMILSIGIGITSFGAVGSFSVSPASKEMNIGDTANITITATNCGGKFSIVSSNPDVVVVNSSSEWIEESSKNIVMTAKGAGTATITVSAVDVGDTDENEVVGSKSIPVNVKSPDAPKPTPDPVPTPNPGDKPSTTKSSNANLSNLITSPVDFKGFKASKTSGYSITVNSDVNTVKVTAKVQHSGASYKVTGNTNLKEGTNIVKIIVTAEDGVTQKTYEVKVYKLAEEEIIPNVVDEEPTQIEIYLKSLTIEEGILEPKFDSKVFEYKIKIENDIEKLNINAIANLDSAIVEVEGNGEFSIGENIVKIIVKDEKGQIIRTYVITVIKEKEDSEAIVLLSKNINNMEPLAGISLKNLVTDEYKIKMFIYRIISIACIVYLASIPIYMLMKEKKVVEKKHKYVSKRMKY